MISIKNTAALLINYTYVNEPITNWSYGFLHTTSHFCCSLFTNFHFVTIFSNLIFIIYGLQELCAYVVRFMNKFLKIVSQNDIFMDFSKLVSNEKLYNQFFFNKEVIKLLRNIDGQFLYSVTSQCMMSEFWFHLFLQTLRYRFQDSSSD